MNSHRSRLVRSIGHATVRAGRYLGPLLRDVIVYVVRLLTDVVNGGQFLWQRWQARRHPDRNDEVEAKRLSLRQRRAARWAPWFAMAGTRRWEVRGVTLAMGLALMLLPLRVSDRPPLPTTPVSTDVASTLAIPGVAPAPPLVSQQTIERFRTEIRRAAAGQAVYLADGPVVAPGSSERWNGFRVGAPVVLRDSDAGFRMWYSGCRLHGLERGCAIGHATSADGVAWTMTPDAVLEPLESAGAFDLGAVAVVRVKDRFYLWYSLWPMFDERPASPLHFATSADGIRWEDHGRVLVSDEPLLAIVPSVVHDGKQFHLWFMDSRRDVTNRHARKEGAPFLRHFMSPDGRSWKEQAEFRMGPLGLGDLRLTAAREDDGSYRAFFFGRIAHRDAPVSSAIGWLASTDGSEWRVAATRPVTSNDLGDDIEQVVDATAERAGGGVLAWFAVQHDGGRQEIRTAFYKE